MKKELPKPLCWGCGYCLEGAVSKKCPECGREFDLADPKTMNMSGTQSRMKRWLLLKSVGNITLGLALVATTALAVVTRPRATGIFDWDWRFSDIGYVCTPANWSRFFSEPATRSWVIAVFFGALALWSLVLLATLIRVCARLLLWRNHRQVMVRAPRRAWLLAALMGVSFFMLPAGEDYRIAHQWMTNELALPPASFGIWTITTPAPSPAPWNAWSENARQVEILQTAIRRISAPEYRVAALRRLATSHSTELPRVIREEIAGESDPKLRAAMINLLCLFREKQDLEIFLGAMEHPDAQVRVAAIDAVTILREPPWGIPEASDQWGTPNAPELRTTPPISVAMILSRMNSRSSPPPGYVRNELEPAIRERFERIMLTGATAGEREAAARALVAWPPEKYEFRAAEWGVWVSDAAGNVKMIRSQLDEIPPFVHRIGNLTSEFEPRVNPVMFIFKPIIHLTTDKPLAVDLEVHINYGRPWFGYPRPDDVDFSTTSNGLRFVRPTISTMDPPAAFGRLEPLGVGYPWMTPQHRRHGSMGSRMGTANEVLDLGLRWQSLIVTPEPPPSSKLEAVPADAKLEWWNRLRKVPASYVTSQGETERFVYYDGPTQMFSPLEVQLSEGKLMLATPVGREATAEGSETFKPIKASRSERRGLFVRVENGAAKGAVIREIPSQSQGKLVDLPKLGEKPEAMLTELLKEAGMTAEEAGGMVDVWAETFFKTDGERFLFLMSSEDYDMFCPIAIRPEPKKLVRCGIILTEFGRQP